MAQEISLKYGCNPNQKPSRIYIQEGELPLQILNGRPGYINFLDALNAWQLVCELRSATGLPAAASFKHVSPAGAAIGRPLTEPLRRAYFVPQDMPLSPLACAYARARGADRMSSFGDFIALSDICDASTAALIRHEVSDGIIAPGYTEEALDILRQKRKGAYNVIQIDTDYVPGDIERRMCFGITFEQGRQSLTIDETLLSNVVTAKRVLTPEQKLNLLVCLITLKYTQSNSVCYAKDGQAIGVGAGQQSRIHCTRLAGGKADLWHLRQHEKVLNLPFRESIGRPERDNAIDVYLTEAGQGILEDGNWQRLFTRRPEPMADSEKRAYLDSVSGVALGSDAFFPFDDNIERAHRSGVTCIAQPGGSVRDAQVISKCDAYGIAMVFTGVRLFHH